MKKTSFFIALFATSLMFFSCKPPKEFIDNIKVSANPLEYKGGKIEVKLEGNFPEKYFSDKLEMTITPVIKSKTTGDRFECEIAKFQGTKVEGNETVIAKAGGKYTHSFVVDYKEGMESSELLLEVNGKLGKKSYTLPAVKVADGVNITPLLVDFGPNSNNIAPVIAPDKFQRIIKEKEEAEIRFLVQRTEIRKSELGTEGVVNLINKIKEAKDAENKEITGINISSYASPEGKLDLNEKLAKGRGKNSEKYLNDQLKKLKTKVSISPKFTAEDWAGFQALMEKSNIQDKALVLRVLSMYSDPEQREKEIKNLTSAYTVIADDILPQLRRSQMTLNVDIIGKSDEVIADLVKNDPKALSVEELLYAATLTNDVKEKENIYSLSIQQYPSEYRGYTNLAAIQYQEGLVEEAYRSAKKGVELNSKSPEANYNMAICALAKNEFDVANNYLGNAGGVGKNLDIVNGSLAILAGDYKKAVSLLGNTKINNAALAKILDKDYSGARSILEIIEVKNGVSYYLSAILGARTNDRNILTDNLSKAVNADQKLKAKAVKDVEFLSFTQDIESIVK